MSEKSNFTILLQLGFWVFMFLFIFDYHFQNSNFVEAFRSSFLELISYAIIITINLHLFIPKALKQKNHLLYLVFVVGLIICYIGIVRLSGLESTLYENNGWRNIFSMVLNVLLFILISYLYWYYNLWHEEREAKLKLKSESLEFELDFLRSQINPHFIFNSLNNVYGLALQKHDNTAPMVSKLSHIMRYAISSSQERKVPLQKEMETLRNYVDLTMLRQPASKNLDIYMEGKFNMWAISPMILIDFVENAFKYSNFQQDEMAWIKIHAEVDETGKFLFTTENNCTSLQVSNSGIGFKNADRQLQIKYPNAYSLDTKIQDNVFSLNLSIQLQPI